MYTVVASITEVKMKRHFESGLWFAVGNRCRVSYNSYRTTGIVNGKQVSPMLISVGAVILTFSGGKNNIFQSIDQSLL